MRAFGKLGTKLDPNTMEFRYYCSRKIVKTTKLPRIRLPNAPKSIQSCMSTSSAQVGALIITTKLM